MGTVELECSFCGKSLGEVKLIAGPGVFICNECIERAAAILAEQQEAVSNADHQ